MVVIVIVLNISAALLLSLYVYKLLDTLHFVQYGAIIERESGLRCFDVAKQDQNFLEIRCRSFS